MPAWERTAELICPLRAVNDIPITLVGEQTASAKQVAIKAMEEANAANHPPTASPASPARNAAKAAPGASLPVSGANPSPNPKANAGNKPGRLGGAMVAQDVSARGHSDQHRAGSSRGSQIMMG